MRPSELPICSTSTRAKLAAVVLGSPIGTKNFQTFRIGIIPVALSLYLAPPSFHNTDRYGFLHREVDSFERGVIYFVTFATIGNARVFANTSGKPRSRRICSPSIRDAFTVKCIRS